MSAPPLIEASGLEKRFGHVRALRPLDLVIPDGQFVALFGPNGAGKTTLLRIVAGLTRPTGGEVRLGGEPAGSDPKHRSRIGFVSHQSHLYDSLSARENLLFAGRLHAVPSLRARIDQLLRTLDLTERADDPVRTFSRGMTQRVSVARALLHDPDILLLDEPFSGLDRHAARVVADLLGSVRRRRRTGLLVTHDLARGLELADRVVVLYRGRVELDRPAEGLELAALEDLYLEAVSGLSGRSERGAA